MMGQRSLLIEKDFTHAFWFNVAGYVNFDPKYPLYSVLLRLHASLTPLATRMSESYSKFSAHITELKMDHREGKLPSDRLTELLGAYISSNVKHGVALSVTVCARYAFTIVAPFFAFCYISAKRGFCLARWVWIRPDLHGF